MNTHNTLSHLRLVCLFHIPECIYYRIFASLYVQKLYSLQCRGQNPSPSKTQYGITELRSHIESALCWQIPGHNNEKVNRQVKSWTLLKSSTTINDRSKESILLCTWSSSFWYSPRDQTNSANIHLFHLSQLYLGNISITHMNVTNTITHMLA